MDSASRSAPPRSPSTSPLSALASRARRAAASARWASSRRAVSMRSARWLRTSARCLAGGMAAISACAASTAARSACWRGSSASLRACSAACPRGRAGLLHANPGAASGEARVAAAWAAASRWRLWQVGRAEGEGGCG